MIKINKLNFARNFADICDKIKKCDFIAIDTEFSGLTCSSETQVTAFDDLNSTYEKCKKNVSNLEILQIGLSLVKYSPSINTYDISSYSFPLFPAIYLDNVPRYTAQAESIKFLSHAKFDFNESINNGISFLKVQKYKEYKNILNRYIQCPSSLNYIFHTYHSNKVYSQYKVKIEKWLCSQNQTEDLKLTLPNLDESFITSILMLVTRDFGNKVTPSYGGDEDLPYFDVDYILLKKTSETNGDVYKKNLIGLLRSSFGFSRIIKLIKKLKKPIVGHNMFLDLLFITDKFCQTLPDTIKEWKTITLENFKYIYDTKHLIEQEISKGNLYLNDCRDTSLSELHLFLEQKLKSHKDLIMPHIKLPIFDDINYHDAAHDSLVTARIFIKLLHLLSYERSRIMGGNCYFNNYLNFIDEYNQKINIVGSSYSYINFRGKDGVRSVKKLVTKCIKLPLENSPDYKIIKLILDQFDSRIIKSYSNKRKIIVQAPEKIMELIEGRLKDLDTRIEEPIPQSYSGKKRLIYVMVIVASTLTTFLFFWK